MGLKFQIGQFQKTKNKPLLLRTVDDLLDSKMRKKGGYN